MQSRAADFLGSDYNKLSVSTKYDDISRKQGNIIAASSLPLYQVVPQCYGQINRYINRIARLNHNQFSQVLW